jgi:hypothetical protein
LFEIISFDKFGNRSLPFEVSGRAYGEYYKTYLLNRGIASMAKSDGKVVLKWSTPPEGALYTTVYYKTSANVDAVIKVPADESETVIDDYLPMSTFYYSTSYKPAENSPDVFESEKAMNIFNIVEYKLLDRSDWTVEVSDQHSEGGGKDKIIDGNYDGSSYWHSQYGPNVPLPHWAIIDMKKSITVARIATLRRSNGDCKTLRYYIGDTPASTFDPDSPSWVKIAEGAYASNDANHTLTLDVTEPVTGRYLVLYMPDSFREPFIGVCEIDVYEIVD